MARGLQIMTYDVPNIPPPNTARDHISFNSQDTIITSLSERHTLIPF